VNASDGRWGSTGTAPRPSSRSIAHTHSHETLDQHPHQRRPANHKGEEVNQLTYHIAMTRQSELLREAAAHRLARQMGGPTKPALIRPATRPRGSSRRSIRGLAAT
jgi:hypothetical protein